MSRTWAAAKIIGASLIVLIIAVLTGIISSAYFEVEFIQVVAAVFVFLNVVLGVIQLIHHEQTDTSGSTTDTDDETRQEPDAGYQSEPHSLSGSSGTEPTTPPTDNETTHNNRSGLLKSDDDILNEVGEKLADRVSFRNNGTIKLDNYDDLNMYSRMMLYVIAKRLAYEDQLADTPDVTGDELLNRFNYTKVDLMLFLDEAGDRLTPAYSMGYRTGNINYAAIKDIEIRVEIQDLAVITDWTVDEQQTTRWNLRSKIHHALTELGEARDTYDSTDDRHRSGTRGEIERHVKNACRAVQQYPVEIGYDTHWKSFSKQAESLLTSLENDLAERTTNCLPQMEGALRTMDEQVQAEILVETFYESYLSKSERSE